MSTDKFSSFEQGDRTAYTMVASMSDSEFLAAIKKSADLMQLFKNGIREGDQLWVFNGDIDWDYYSQTQQFRVTSQVANPYAFGESQSPQTVKPIDPESKSFFGRGSKVEPYFPE